ncbi:DUF1835 domain-containing protein [Lysinibacillus sp. NPDC094403]|uniref:DUF1835 domain-containing protein n=1 Tax=Lysinibacillus sp. NPDC094403 TaxID=3390581 RepID=UPI003CFF69FA
MKNIEKLKHAIQKLSEADAKSMLFFSLINEQSAENIKRFILKQVEDHTKFKNVQTVHIVFGHSPGGSLRAAFRETDYEITEDIIILPSDFSVGPLMELHKESGIMARLMWLQERYSIDNDELKVYQQDMIDAFEKIYNIPPHQDIIIWTCQNAHEQTGLRIVLALLKNKLNSVFVLDTFKIFHEMYTFPQLAEENYPRSSGEIKSEDLLLFYEHYESRPLKKEQRQALCEEGLGMLYDDYNIIRSWEHHELWNNMTEDRDDAFIISCAKRLHEEDDEVKYYKAARLIGEVLGHMEQYRGDEWIEYRLRTLVKQGFFTYKGDLKAMRLYEVKLTDEYLTNPIS